MGRHLGNKQVFNGPLNVLQYCLELDLAINKRNK